MIRHTPDQQSKKRRPPEAPQPLHQPGQVSLFMILGGDHHIPGRQWLLIKRRDEEARPGYEVVQEYDTSVLSNRTIEDLEAATAAGTLDTYHCE